MENEMLIPVLGLHNSGKTFIIFRLFNANSNPPPETSPFHKEKLQYQGKILTLFESPGIEKLIPLWKHYIESSIGLIFVIDCSEKDKKKYQKSKEVLHDLIKKNSKPNFPVLVFLNKKDLENFDDFEMKKFLDLDSFDGIDSMLFCCSAKTGEGLWEGIEWLSKRIPTSPLSFWGKIKNFFRKK